MSLPSFLVWLDHRLHEVPDAASLALLVARSGAAGVSRERLARALGLSPETLENLLREAAFALAILGPTRTIVKPRRPRANNRVRLSIKRI